MKKVGEQLQMFDTSGIGPKRPGQKSFDEWLATESPVYHGTYRQDFGNAPVAHFGTIGQASNRLDAARQTLIGSTGGRDNYYDPSSSVEDYYDDDEANESFTHIGRVYARRMDEAPMRGMLKDAEANAAEAGHLMGNEMYEEWEVPHSVRESAGTLMPTHKWGDSMNPEVEHYSPRSAAGARALGEGRPLAYRNFYEGDNPVDADMGTPRNVATTSYIIPSVAQRSWEQDVISDPGTQPWVADYLGQQRMKGNESVVPFPSQTIPRNDGPQQMNFYDLYDPGAPEPNAPPFPRELAMRQQMAQARKIQRPILNSIEFDA